jgi:hypothetical protein
LRPVPSLSEAPLSFHFYKTASRMGILFVVQGMHIHLESAAISPEDCPLDNEAGDRKSRDIWFLQTVHTGNSVIQGLELSFLFPCPTVRGRASSLTAISFAVMLSP